MKYDSKMQAFGAGDIPMSEDNFNALKEANRTMLHVPIDRNTHILVVQPALERTRVQLYSPVLNSAAFTVFASVVFTRCSSCAAQDRLPAPRLA